MRLGKVMIRASIHLVETKNPSLLHDSHLVLLYVHTEKTLRQVAVVLGRIPNVAIGTERFHSAADNTVIDFLDSFNFYLDPMDETDKKLIYLSGRRHATGEVVIDIGTSGNTDGLNKQKDAVSSMRKSISE